MPRITHPICSLENAMDKWLRLEGVSGYEHDDEAQYRMWERLQRMASDVSMGFFNPDYMWHYVSNACRIACELYEPGKPKEIKQVKGIVNKEDF